MPLFLSRLARDPCINVYEWGVKGRSVDTLKFFDREPQISTDQLGYVEEDVGKSSICWI